MVRVCQCWDDGNVDDIRLAGLLRQHGATATFNINPGLHRDERWQKAVFRGRAIIKLARGELAGIYRGFDIANHGLLHRHLTRLDDAALTEEICRGSDGIESLFGRRPVGFVYPYGDHDARTMAAVHSAGHRYARTAMNAEPAWPPADAMALHPSCHHLDPRFWELYTRAAQRGGVFYFWGHSYELSVEDDWLAFERKIAAIAADPSARWVGLPELFAS